MENLFKLSAVRMHRRGLGVGLVNDSINDSVGDSSFEKRNKCDHQVSDR